MKLTIMKIESTTEKERWHDTLEALEDIRLRRVIDGSKVHTWLDSWGTKEELPPPAAK